MIHLIVEDFQYLDKFYKKYVLLTSRGMPFLVFGLVMHKKWQLSHVFICEVY